MRLQSEEKLQELFTHIRMERNEIDRINKLNVELKEAMELVQKELDETK